MQWITHFEDAQWKIESNATIAEANRFYAWEKSFVRITLKVAGESVCYINGEKYAFYNEGEQVILEITDLIRAFVGGGGTISIRDFNNDYIYDLEYVSIAGQRVEKSNESFLPFHIPYSVTSEIPFWLELCQKQEYFNSLNEWVTMTNNNWITNPSTMPMDMDLKTLNTDTLRIADTTNFTINETSGDYGFALRTIDLKKGESYKFSANGNAAGAAIGAKLLVELSDGVNYFRQLFIDSATNETVSDTFFAPVSATCTIISYYYPGGFSGDVTVNWYKIELISGAQTRMIDLPCTNEHILFEWVGRFGVKKSWWFKKESVISEATKTINLQTLDNGFNTLKDKNTNLIISHRNADNLTQHYLSDIVLSDEVYCYPDETVESKLQVRVETNSFEVGLNNRDIVLTINKNAYDTI